MTYVILFSLIMLCYCENNTISRGFMKKTLPAIFDNFRQKTECQVGFLFKAGKCRKITPFCK